MTDQTHPTSGRGLPELRRYRPDWVPELGHALRLTGVRFDAVRLPDVQGLDLAQRHAALVGTDADYGPIVREALGLRWMYFLLPPCSVAALQWPPTVRLFGGGTRTVAYVGVPALDGDTWPLCWYAPPTHSAPYVDPVLLNKAAHTTPSLPVHPLPTRAGKRPGTSPLDGCEKTVT